MDQREQEIIEDLEQTRASLAEKLELIEEKVQETVESATTTVGEAIETVGDTIGRVKRTLDLRYQIAQHPWLALGGAVVAGYVLGSRPAAKEAPSGVETPPVSLTPQTERRPSAPMLVAAAASTRELLQDFGVVEIIREMVKEILPKFVPKIEEALGLTADGKNGQRREVSSAGSRPPELQGR